MRGRTHKRRTPKISKAAKMTTIQDSASLHPPYVGKGEGPMLKTKCCTKCGQDSPRENFHKKKAAHDGLSSWCKTCKTANALSPQRGSRALLSPTDLAERAKRKAAYRKVEQAVKDGVLTKPEDCPQCFETTASINMHAHHHRGHEHPLDIVWVCRSCNLLDPRHSGYRQYARDREYAMSPDKRSNPGQRDPGRSVEESSSDPRFTAPQEQHLETDPRQGKGGALEKPRTWSHADPITGDPTFPRHHAIQAELDHLRSLIRRAKETAPSPENLRGYVGPDGRFSMRDFHNALWPLFNQVDVDEGSTHFTHPPLSESYQDFDEEDEARGRVALWQSKLSPEMMVGRLLKARANHAHALSGNRTLNDDGIRTHIAALRAIAPPTKPSED